MRLRLDNCCNVIIKRLADYGLYVTYQLHLFVLKSYMPQSHLLCQCYKLFFVLPYYCYNLIPFITTRLPISSKFFWSKSLMYCMWAKQAVCFDRWLIKKNYLQTNAFPNLVMVEWEMYFHALQRIAIGREVTSKVVREIAGRTRPGLTFGTSTSAFTIYYTTR